MTFEIDKAIEILRRTPETLETLLDGLSDGWIRNHEGEGTWSPYAIVGHLIQGEKTDWMPRARIILSDTTDKTFVPFDRFAQLEEDQTRPIGVLLAEFRKLRSENLKELESLSLDKELLQRRGIHPELGEATLRELLSTWVVHDLGHISQITRVMAKQYQGEVGVWQAYLGILKK